MTPWQKVHLKFGCSAAALAKAIGRDRSKVSRAIKDPVGAINSTDMDALMRAAEHRGISLSLDDFRPTNAEAI